MTPRDIDRAIYRAAGAEPGPDQEMLARISARLEGSLQSVRPMTSIQTRSIALIIGMAAVAILGAIGFRILGLPRLTGVQAAAIFTILLAAACLTAWAAAAAMTPGARRMVGSGALLAASILAPLAAFAILFHDYSLGRFVPQGIACLKAGLLVAVPATILCLLILRRGYPVNRAAAGIAIGALAGLAGLTMLELHCPILRAPHIMLWHVAPVPIAALTCWAIYSFGWKRRDAELMQ